MLPAVIRETPLHDVPTIVVAVLLIFWLSRVPFTNAYKPRILSVDSLASQDLGPTAKD